MEAVKIDFRSKSINKNYGPDHLADVICILQGYRRNIHDYPTFRETEHIFFYWKKGVNGPPPHRRNKFELSGDILAKEDLLITRSNLGRWGQRPIVTKR